MIVSPKISKLLQNTDDVYGLVVAVAKRSRDVAEEATANHVELNDKAINIAIGEFADNRLQVVLGE